MNRQHDIYEGVEGFQNAAMLMLGTPINAWMAGIDQNEKFSRDLIKFSRHVTPPPLQGGVDALETLSKSWIEGHRQLFQNSMTFMEPFTISPS